MANSDNEQEGFFHNLIHRLFQKDSTEISKFDPNEYRFASEFNYWTTGGSKPFTEEEIQRVKVLIESWAVPDVRFATVNKNEKGFRVTIHSNLPNAQALGTDLFLKLAKQIFREMDKSVAYGRAEE